MLLLDLIAPDKRDIQINFFFLILHKIICLGRQILKKSFRLSSESLLYDVLCQCLCIIMCYYLCTKKIKFKSKSYVVEK